MKHELEAKLKIATRDLLCNTNMNGVVECLCAHDFEPLKNGKRMTLTLTMPPGHPPRFTEWDDSEPDHLRGSGDWIGRIDALTVHFYNGRWHVQAEVTLAICDEEPRDFWDRWEHRAQSLFSDLHTILGQPDGEEGWGA